MPCRLADVAAGVFLVNDLPNGHRLEGMSLLGADVSLLVMLGRDVPRAPTLLVHQSPEIETRIQEATKFQLATTAPCCHLDLDRGLLPQLLLKIAVHLGENLKDRQWQGDPLTANCPNREGRWALHCCRGRLQRGDDQLSAVDKGFGCQKYKPISG